MAVLMLVLLRGIFFFLADRGQNHKNWIKQKFMMRGS